MHRSPSFSRSGASTTITSLPVPDVLERVLDATERRRSDRSSEAVTVDDCFHGSDPVGQEALDVLRQLVHLDVDAGARGQPAQRRDLAGVWDQPHLEAVARPGRRRSATRRPRRRSPSRRGSARAPSGRGTRRRPRCRPRAPPTTSATASTWPCTTWPPSGSPARSAGSTLTRSPARQPRRACCARASRPWRRRRRRRRRPRSPSGRRRRWPPSRPSRTPARTVCGIATVSREPSASCSTPAHLADLLDDAGEHPGTVRGNDCSPYLLQRGHHLVFAQRRSGRLPAHGGSRSQASSSTSGPDGRASSRRRARRRPSSPGASPASSAGRLAVAEQQRAPRTARRGRAAPPASSAPASVAPPSQSTRRARRARRAPAVPRRGSRPPASRPPRPPAPSRRSAGASGPTEHQHRARRRRSRARRALAWSRARRSHTTRSGWRSAGGLDVAGRELGSSAQRACRCRPARRRPAPATRARARGSAGDEIQRESPPARRRAPVERRRRLVGDVRAAEDAVRAEAGRLAPGADRERIVGRRARRPRRPPRAGAPGRGRRPWRSDRRRPRPRGVTPAATSASAHGGVRPWWEHGSRVT